MTTRHHPVWSRYIGLLVDRDPTHVCLSDASYGGLGSFSLHEHFNFRWRLTRQDLIDAGFDMKSIDEDTSEPDGTSDGLHINVLEFVAMIIELWFVIILIQRHGPYPGGYIVQLLGDNTTALSWLRYAARSHRPIVRDLSRFAMALTLSCPLSLKLSGKHLKGKLNIGADALSRPNGLSNVGLRYTNALPTLELSSLSGPLRALVHDSYDHFISQDRGSIRAGNDKTFDSRADYFECWLERNQFSVELFSRLSQSEAIAVIGTYVRQVNLGDSIKGQNNLIRKNSHGLYESSSNSLSQSIASASFTIYSITSRWR